MSLKLSIIIPYHDSKNTLSRLLDSIPISEEIEVLVVNDHSDDITDIVSNHPRAILYSQNPGKRWAGAARNYGISKASGEFVLFADSDDYFINGFFDIVSEFFTLNNDIVYFSPTAIKSNGEASQRHLRYANLVESYLKNKDSSIRYRFHVPWSKLYRRKFLLDKNIRFDEVIASNDIVFSLKSSILAENIDADNRNIYCVVESQNSLTKNKSEEILDSRFYASCRYNDFLKSIGDPNEAPMSQFIHNAYGVSFYKALSVFFYCKYKKYKIFNGWYHFLNAIIKLKKT